jgi:hypothetical protein
MSFIVFVKKKFEYLKFGDELGHIRVRGTAHSVIHGRQYLPEIQVLAPHCRTTDQSFKKVKKIKII